MRIAAIIQARMGSSRLPGKVLRSVAGKPLLQYLLERLAHCQELNGIIVATSESEEDLPIVDFCSNLGVVCERGSLNNVADRFRSVAAVHALDAFVRVSGDSPLLDITILRQCLSRFTTQDIDVVTNVFPRTFPRGQSSEVVKTSSFNRAYRLMSKPDDFEHVTQIFYRHPDTFQIENVRCEQDYADVHLAVDAQRDLELFDAIVKNMTRPHWQYVLADIAELYRTAQAVVAAE